MRIRKLLECLSFLLFVHSVTSQTTIFPPNLGGGADGSNGDAHLVGTPDTPKLEIRALCTKTSTTNVVDMVLSVYQSDVNFKYSNIGPDSGKYVQYESCKLITAKEYIDSNLVNTATSVTSCGGSAQLTRVDSTSTFSNNFQTRTFTTKIQFDVTAASYDCGGYKDSNVQSVFAVYCKRDVNYAKAFDYVFLTYYDADAAQCLSTTLTTSFDVGNPPIVQIHRKYDVTFKAYTNADITTWPAGPESKPVGNVAEITGAINLGTAMYLEACLKLPNTPPSNYQFFDDGVAPIGIYVKTCTATNDAASAAAMNAGQAGIAADAPVTIISNGCGLNKDPTKVLPINTPAFKYVKDASDMTNDWLRTPNCFRSYPFEAVSFARKLSNKAAVTVYRCEVEYCTSSDDKRCFGTKTATDRSGYPSCTRKKRETPVTMSGYPEILTVRVLVSDPEYDSNEAKDSCGQTPTFIGLTTVLGVLLIMLLAAAGFMTRNIQSIGDMIEKSWSAASTQNRGVCYQDDRRSYVSKTFT